jgi:carbonic anhydrase/acetyltransferase-like protein (isoleucine patch superfamily)
MTHGPIILPWKGVHPSIAETAFIAPGATVVGDTVIGADSSIWFGCVLRGDVNEIRVGQRSNIQDGTVVHVTGGGLGTYVGDDVLVGHGCILHACTLESGCFVGMGATLLDGVVVETGAMVAAGAMVSPGKRVPRGELWAGSPARKMRDMTAEEIERPYVSCRHYAEMGRRYREMLAASA